MCEIVKVPWRLSRWRMERIVVKAPQAPARGSAQRRLYLAETFVQKPLAEGGALDS